MDPLTQTAIEAAIKGAISEGFELIPKGAKATWNGLKTLISNWSGGKKEEVEEAIEEVVDGPDKKVRQKGLASTLAEIEEPPPAELVELAEKLKELLAADSAAAEKTHHVTQIVENVRNSAIAQVGRDGNATAINTGGGDVVQDQKKTS